jgi:hypothetical protein
VPIQSKRAGAAGDEVVNVANSPEQAARYETAFREVNEQIAELTGLLSETRYALFICECSDTNCADSLEVKVAEYEAVRSDGTRFVVLPGHQHEGIERVVEGNGRFLIVEKLGDAGEIASASNPRRS